MAPRTGPRGVTNEDVARRAGVSYVYAPTTNQPAPIDASALANFLIGGQAPGYGMKYGGFPSAAYGQAAITGQAYQIADLARQAQALAAARQAELVASADRQLRPIESQVASDYRRQQRRAGQTVENLLEKAAQKPVPIMGPGGMYYVPEDIRPVALFAASRAFKEQNKRLEDERRATMEAQSAPIVSQLESNLASEVRPAQGIAEALGSFTPSQLAQQIAVSRYGYDPMLASGLFGAQTDLDYVSQQQAIQDAERRAMGYNTGLSTDEILAQQLSPEEFQQYQINKALGSYENTMTDYTQEDQNLFDVYGVLPSNDQERAIMNNPEFANVLVNARKAMSEQKSVSPTSAAGQIARKFLLDNPTKPAEARLLDDILRNYAFLIEDPTSNLNIVLPSL